MFSEPSSGFFLPRRVLVSDPWAPPGNTLFPRHREDRPWTALVEANVLSVDLDLSDMDSD